MIKWAAHRINFVCSKGDFASRSAVLPFAILVTLFVVVAANILDIVALASIDAVGLLPYSMVSAVTVGFIITTVLAGLLTFCVTYVIGLAIHELSISRASFEILSRTDALSGLLNRRAFLEAFATAPEATSLALFDIDRFKSINDRYGHDAGDRVIVSVAQVLTDIFGSAHVAARIGGEEFAVLISGLTPAERFALADAARKEIGERPVVLDEVTAVATVSGGVADRDDHPAFGPLFFAADRALYVAKASGRNLILHDRDIPAAVKRNREVASAPEQEKSRVG